MRLVAAMVGMASIAAIALAQQTPPSASLSATERTGEKLFLQRCALCHLGAAPTYEPYGPALDGAVATRGEEVVRAIILEGSPGMPAWKYSLTGAQVDAIVAYMKRLAPPKRQA